MVPQAGDQASKMGQIITKGIKKKLLEKVDKS
jgi:hypothetical protein